MLTASSSLLRAPEDGLSYQPQLSAMNSGMPESANDSTQWRLQAASSRPGFSRIEESNALNQRLAAAFLAVPVVFLAGALDTVLLADTAVRDVDGLPLVAFFAGALGTFLAPET